MYKQNAMSNPSFEVNQSKQGESIETKVERIVNNKEPIKDGAPLMYIDRKEGIRPSTNIRTDRFEIAIEAMDKVAKSYKAKREERAKTAEQGKEEGKIGEPKSIQGDPKTGTTGA